ncbi:MAG: hypothetical protein ACUX7D_04480 [Candidatus Methanodesulfokora washburnensis]|jgi:hypothetical protein
MSIRCALLLILLVLLTQFIPLRAQYMGVSTRPTEVYAGGTITVMFNIVKSYPGSPESKNKLLGFQVRFILPNEWNATSKEIWGYDVKGNSLYGRGVWVDNRTAKVNRGDEIIEAWVSIIARVPAWEAEGQKSITVLINATIQYPNGTIKEVRAVSTGYVYVKEFSPFVYLNLDRYYVIPPQIVQGNLTIAVMNPLPAINLDNVSVKISYQGKNILEKFFYKIARAEIPFQLRIPADAPAGDYSLDVSISFFADGKQKEIRISRNVSVRKPANISLEIISLTDRIAPWENASVTMKISNPSAFTAKNVQVHIEENGILNTFRIGDMPSGYAENRKISFRVERSTSISIWASWTDEGESTPKRTEKIQRSVSVGYPYYIYILVALVVIGGVIYAKRAVKHKTKAG